MNIWNPASTEQIKFVELFKKIFINQEKHNLNLIFDDNFGIHNGFNQADYSHYEFEEFFLKCEKFGLKLDATIVAYNIGNDFIYFSLGKKNEKAVFESIFKWNPLTNKVQGNQYEFKIEPKIQFKKNKQSNIITHNRRINIKPINNEITIKQVFSEHSSYEFNLIKSELEEHLGGNFYSLSYMDEIENLNTYWNNITIFTNQGKFKKRVLMRGTDHPLFIDNLFPTLIDSFSFNIESNIYPVIINVIFEDNSQNYYKYPLEKTFSFSKKIKQICLTDTLSFDWILDI